MSAPQEQKPIVHFVGSIPLPDAEAVFRTWSAAAGPHALERAPSAAAQGISLNRAATIGGSDPLFTKILGTA
jgi:hypothetical protein